MFNVRVKTFYDSEQIQIYSRAQYSKGEVYRKKIDRNTGEIFPAELPTHYDHIVFDDGVVFNGREVHDFHSSDSESLRISYSRTIKKIYDITRSNRWDWFFTLTFNGDKVDRYDYAAVSKKMIVWLANMRRICPNMVYIVVPEQHKDGAWHFHGLFKNVDDLDISFSGRLDNKLRKIYNVSSYKWGFSTATEISDSSKASSYLCKYITKDLCLMTKGKRRYWASKNVNLPVVKEFMVEDLNYLKIVSELAHDDAHLKSIECAYVNVSYIDQSIPQIPI